MTAVNSVRHLHRSAKAGRVQATLPAQWTIRAFGIYAVAQGTGVCFGGIGRWASPAYEVVKRMPLSPYGWGAALVLFGVMILIGSVAGKWWTKAVGLFGLSVWSFVFAAGTFTATLTAHAGTTGGPVYLLVSVVAAILITIKERPHAPPRTQPV